MGTHARIDRWGCATKNELKMWCPRKMLLLHNTRETLADCSNGRDTKLVHNLYEAKRMPSYPNYAMYVCVSVSSHAMIQDDQVWYDTKIWGCYGTCLKALLFSFAKLWVLSIYFFCQNAMSSNQCSYFAYAGTKLWHFDGCTHWDAMRYMTH
jgi:hypothetical protein